MIGVDLGNLNPAVHYGIAMFNLTRMELAEDRAQQAHITPAVARFLEDLDRERLAVAEAFGVKARSIHQAYAVPGKVEIGPLAEMMRQIVVTRKGVNGPKTLDSRYVTEDVPYGLQTTIRLADLTGVEVPLARLRSIPAICASETGSPTRPPASGTSPETNCNAPTQSRPIFSSICQASDPPARTLAATRSRMA